MPSERRAVRVAVIDSGIHPAHPHVQGVSAGIALTADGHEHDDWVDRIGHGTAVAAAIREKAPDVELVSVRVFDRNLSMSVNTLIRAIERSVDFDCQLINLSLGTTRLEHAARLRAAAEAARRAGALIVGAREDAGQQFLPGSLPGVVGVVVDWNCPRHEIRATRLATGQIVCAASGYPRDIPGVPPERNLMGVSFAVANTTGRLAAIAALDPGGFAADPAAIVARTLIDNPLVPA